MKIEIGEYIRTKQGTIGQIIEKYEKYCVIANRRGEIDVLYENIAKHGKDIIDLIQRGDYVNGYRVRGKTNEKVVVDYYYYSEELCDGWWIYFRKDQIISIVTKEQFFSMEYRV